jgi:hypothetical protein
MGRRGQLVAELAAYDEARRRVEQLVKQGRKGLEGRLARLCVNKAKVHMKVADTPGALAEYDRAIEIWERRFHQEGWPHLADDLSIA